MKTTKEGSEINKIVELIGVGTSAWVEAGKRLCALIDQDRTVIQRIRNAHPSINPATLYAIERVGRQKLLPELLVLFGPGWSRLRNMPLDVQRKHLREPVRMLKSEELPSRTMAVNVDKMTDAQARQVFNERGKTMRTMLEQRRWLISHKESLQALRATKNWKLEENDIVVLRYCRITLRDLEEMVRAIKKAAAA